MKLFPTTTKTITKYKLLEVERATPLPELSNELKESLRTLQLHPGFQYLLARLRLERSRLEEVLHSSDLDEKGFCRLQAGIFYSKWLESETARLTQIPPRVVREATVSEDSILSDLYAFDAALERVG